MWNRKEIKETGKLAFKANYWRSVLASLLVMALTAGSATMSWSKSSDIDADDFVDDSYDNDTMGAMQDVTNSMSDDDKAFFAAILIAIAVAVIMVMVAGCLFRIFIFNPLHVGCYGFFKENAGGNHPDLGILKAGFGNYKHTLITMLMRDIFLFLWTCLLIVPGIIKAYSYRMVPFILRDNPEMSPTEVIAASKKLMNGHKWNTFVFDLSYIGWYLLGIITLNLANIFWTEPYRQNANGALYLKLIGEDSPAQIEEAQVVA